VKSFYRLFDIEIPFLPQSGNKARPLQENKDIPTKEHLQAVLKVCDLFEKALILVGASSGLSANKIRNLKAKILKIATTQRQKLQPLACEEIRLSLIS